MNTQQLDVMDLIQDPRIMRLLGDSFQAGVTKGYEQGLLDGQMFGVHPAVYDEQQGESHKLAMDQAARQELFGDQS